MTLQEAFNTADNLVRMQQLEIDKLSKQLADSLDSEKYLVMRIDKLEEDEETNLILLSEIERLKGEIELLKSKLQHSGVDCLSYIGELAEAQNENERLKEENFNYSEVQVQLKWAKETNSQLLSENERLKIELSDSLDSEKYLVINIDGLEEDIEHLKQENDRLKRYELEYKKREWDEAILYNNLFKASMLVSELANALKARQTDGDTPKYTESVSKLIKKADEITYQPKDQNAVGNLEHSMEG